MISCLIHLQQVTESSSLSPASTDWSNSDLKITTDWSQDDVFLPLPKFTLRLSSINEEVQQVQQALNTSSSSRPRTTRTRVLSTETGEICEVFADKITQSANTGRNVSIVAVCTKLTAAMARLTYQQIREKVRNLVKSYVVYIEV
ncbi:hypothetical protein DPMN_087207 [Dreissena polymorpha]|uniref:Uncharacterized protein n=1 Tax=Dreissena polymorpha TaxID=45954 RepID=A0A9D4KS97_DREPO|nr:hypothetical protein DPMN_087207 [Dreissena polymorpha]